MNTSPESSSSEKATDPATDEVASNPDRKNRRKDASRGEVAMYAFGNVEASLADQFFNVLNNILIVAMHVNPLLIGLILAIKSLWDSVTDPVMAWITDNTRSRWGRRRPYILVGGVSRIALLVLICVFMPTGGHLTPNFVMEAQKFANEGIKEGTEAHKVAMLTYEQMEAAAPDLQNKMLVIIAKNEKTAQTAFTKISDHLGTLEDDATGRARELEERRLALAEILAIDPPPETLDKIIVTPQGLVQNAEEKLTKATDLIAKAREAQRKAIAGEWVSRHILAARGVQPDPVLSDPAQAQHMANAAYTAAGLEPMDIFVLEKKPAPKPGKKTGLWTNMKEGLNAFQDPKNAEQRPLIFYVLLAVLLFTTLTTIQSVPYYALGIELSPSYSGRTQVVTYRAVMNKIAGLLQPWVPVFCFSLLFTTALSGLVWVAVVACAIGIPSTILMCWFVKERTEISTVKKRQAGLFRSMWEVMNSRDFLKIFALYWFIGLTNGMFQQIGFFLNVYWVMGSALSGAKLGAWVSMLAWGLGLISLPLINWGCHKFQKHRVLQFAIIWMSIGTALNWWCMDPNHPEYQFILPFFFSIGIGSVFTVLPTMMADVTDVDELKHGLRREGMFGAVMAFLMKMIGTFTPILAGAVLVIAGFDPTMEYEQNPDTILRMRLMYSFVPAGMLLLSLIILWRYPLTRERVETIKDELHRRHEKEEA